MISKNTKLRNNLKKIAARCGIDDILLFGSAVRGKETPRDIDILVVFEGKVDKKEEYNVRKELETYYKNVSILSKTRKTILEPSFSARESVLFEAVSLLDGSNLARTYGFDSLGMFKYSFNHWSKLKKTKFYHALNGRNGGKGMLHMLQGIRLSDNTLLTPLEHIEPMRSFLDFWELDYIYVPLMIPHRLNKKRILQS